jgi:predicted transposase/invertase (TIGR01784 family)
MVFIRYQNLLKRLVAASLRISLESITEFVITNQEIPPSFANEKYCRLDIRMVVNGQRVVLEVQVRNEKDFPERSLYYWARDFSSALPKRGEYAKLPRVIVINIVAFRLFKCKEFYSEFQPLEIARHTPLTDRMRLMYFELPKLPKVVDAGDELGLWLALFKAKTEEDLKKLEGIGAPIMGQAIEAYRQVTATDEFKELERLRFKARHDEASALGNAERRGERRSERKAEKRWQGVVAEKDAALASRDAALVEQAALIAELRARLGE